jgi:hypothetical protein
MRNAVLVLVNVGIFNDDLAPHPWSTSTATLLVHWGLGGVGFKVGLPADPVPHPIPDALAGRSIPEQPTGAPLSPYSTTGLLMR